MVEAMGLVCVARVLIQDATKGVDHGVIGGYIVTGDAQTLDWHVISEHCHTLLKITFILTLSDIPMMRAHIAYTHNEPCVTLIQHFCNDLGQFALKDDKGRHALRPFAMSYTILQYSTVLPFTFATFSDSFRPFATFLDFALFNTPPVCVAFSGTFHQTLFT